MITLSFFLYDAFNRTCRRNLLFTEKTDAAVRSTDCLTEEKKHPGIPVCDTDFLPSQPANQR